MRLSRVAHSLDTAFTPFSRIINSVGTGILAIMMLLTVADVILRYFLNRPIPGSFEITVFMMVVLVSLSLAYTGLRGGHVNVDIVLTHIPPKARAILNSITGFICAVLFAVVSWQCVRQAMVLLESDLTSDVLYIPAYPFLLITSFGFAALAFAFIVRMFKSLCEVTGK